MNRAWIAAFALACLPAAAQFGGLGNILKGIDVNKAVDTTKKLADANKEFTTQEEIELGDGIAAQFLGGAPLGKDANLQRYVNRVGRWVALHSARPDLPWTFGVMDTRTVNAFAMPGGTTSRRTCAPAALRFARRAQARSSRLTSSTAAPGCRPSA